MGSSCFYKESLDPEEQFCRGAQPRLIHAAGGRADAGSMTSSADAVGGKLDAVGGSDGAADAAAALNRCDTQPSCLWHPCCAEALQCLLIYLGLQWCKKSVRGLEVQRWNAHCAWPPESWH